MAIKDLPVKQVNVKVYISIWDRIMKKVPGMGMTIEYFINQMLLDFLNSSQTETSVLTIEDVKPQFNTTVERVPQSIPEEAKVKRAYKKRTPKKKYKRISDEELEQLINDFFEISPNKHADPEEIAKYIRRREGVAWKRSFVITRLKRLPMPDLHGYKLNSGASAPWRFYKGDMNEKI